MTSIQPELWVESPREALAFYEAAFGATVRHCVGDGDDIVAQLGVGEAAFWVAPASPTMKRLSPRAIDGATSRTLLVGVAWYQPAPRLLPLVHARVLQEPAAARQSWGFPVPREQSRG